MLLVGAGGCLGRALQALLEAHGIPVLASQRFASAPLFVDIQSEPDTWRLPEASWRGAAFLLAAQTDTAACERDPEGARKMNVGATLTLAERLVNQGCFVVFPSTSQVFSGDIRRPDTMAAPDPLTVYGRHKAEVERVLREKWPGQVAIVRLTKVLDAGNRLVRHWTEALLRGETVEAFTDMCMAPVSEVHAAEGLLAAVGKPGIHHVSAMDDISYRDAAALGAQTLGVDSGLVRGVPCAGRGLFAPRNTALGAASPCPDSAEVVRRAFVLCKEGEGC